MSELPGLMPQTDYPDLHQAIDEVHVRAFYVQRYTLPWLKGTPDDETIQLRWLAQSLADLSTAVETARLKVESRWHLAEAARESLEAEAREATA